VTRNAVRKTPTVKSERFQGGARKAARATTRAAGARSESRIDPRGRERLAGLGALARPGAGSAGLGACSVARLTRHATTPRTSERRAAPIHVACTPIVGRRRKPAAKEPVSVPAVFTA
jgi:hypothetical protein